MTGRGVTDGWGTYYALQARTPPRPRLITPHEAAGTEVGRQNCSSVLPYDALPARTPPAPA